MCPAYPAFNPSTTLESSIYSTTEGLLIMVPVLGVPCVLLAGALVLLFRTTEERAPTNGFLRWHSAGQWMWRLVAAIAAFPLVYFVFGVAVSPFVAEYYRQGVAGLALPSVSLILGVQCFRSVLFLLVNIPLLLLWSGTRRALIGALGLAHAVMVAAYDPVLAYQVPAVLVAIHSLEILADSMVYAWLFAALVLPKGEAGLSN